MYGSCAESFAGLTEGLDEIAAINPASRTTAEKQELMVQLAGFITRAQAQQLRVLDVGDDVAEQTGSRSAAAWLAEETRDALVGSEPMPSWRIGSTRDGRASLPRVPDDRSTCLERG